MNHLVVIAVFAATGINAQYLASFGVTVANTGSAATPDTVSVSLWHGFKLYYCSYDGMSQGTTYSCSPGAGWGVSNGACDSWTADYRLLVDNQNANAVDIDKVFLTVDGQEYTIDAWCTSDEWQASNNHDIEYSPSSCQDGYVNYDVIGLDTDQMDTTTAMFHFELTNPGQTSYNALMEDAADICILDDGSCVCQPEPPQCDDADMTKVNWHDMLNENVPSPSLLHSEEITFDASTLSLTFSASLEYVGKSADGNFDDEFNLGTTYWIDFESFSSVDGDVDAAGTCTNRRSADYVGLSSANLWSFPVNPSDLETESTENRMAYPPSDWTLNAEDCSAIKYERTMSWADLTSCRDEDDNPLITVVDAERTLTLSGQLFVELLSPYSAGTTGVYRKFPLVQQRFEIVLNKGVEFLASTDVQLFIPSVMAYGRDDDGNYEVTMLIQSADFVKMNDVAAVTGPHPISGIETVAGDCLSASSFTCGQIFTAKIVAECPPGGNVDLSGSYNFAFTPECRDSDGDGEAQPECQVFMTTLDESAGKVALAVDADFVDPCDIDLFTVDFTGSLTFYEDDQFTEAVDENSDPFVIGQDTIYGEVAVDIDVPSFPDLQFEDVAIQTVYVCTADPGKALSMESPVGSDGVGGCLSTDVDADALYTVIGNAAIPEYEGATIDETASNAARFSFLTFATARETIYVHVQALLTVNIDGRRRRMRVLLQDDGNANQFRSYVGTASVVEGEDSVDEPSVVDGSARSAVNLVVVIMVFAAVMAG